MGKGFKLPGVTPLKQTGSASGGFFQPLNPRNYGASLTSPYANPQSYSAYFPSSTMGGAKTITDLGNTFSDIVTTVSGKGTETDTDTSSDVSGSDITISATGQLPTQTTTDPGLERGSDPKLEEKIAKAEAKGNLKKAARLQAKQDKNIVRQTEGEKRIQARQDEKLDRVTARQEGLTKDFEDKNFAGRMLSSIGNIFRSPTTMKKESPLDFVPSQQMGQPQAFSYDVPQQANMIGNARPLFNQQTMGMAEAAFGNPAMRQASVGAAFQMKTIPEGDEGKGLRSLPDNVVEKMGYDSAAKMVGKEIPKKMSKKLTEKPKVPVVETTKQAFGVTLDGKKVNLGETTSTIIPEKDFKQR